MPLAAKIAKADIVVDNSGSKKDLDQSLKRQTIPAIFKALKLDSVYEV